MLHEQNVNKNPGGSNENLSTLQTYFNQPPQIYQPVLENFNSPPRNNSYPMESGSVNQIDFSSKNNYGRIESFAPSFDLHHHSINYSAPPSNSNAINTSSIGYIPPGMYYPSTSRPPSMFDETFKNGPIGTTMVPLNNVGPTSMVVPSSAPVNEIFEPNLFDPRNCGVKSIVSQTTIVSPPMLDSSPYVNDNSPPSHFVEHIKRDESNSIECDLTRKILTAMENDMNNSHCNSHSIYSPDDIPSKDMDNLDMSDNSSGKSSKMSRKEFRETIGKQIYDDIMSDKFSYEEIIEKYKKLFPQYHSKFTKKFL